MADRAPRLASLLNATVMADDNYEHDLEKHLLRRAKLSPEQMQQREANRAKTWEDFDAGRRGKQTERNLAQQAALLSVSAYDGQADEYDDFDQEEGEQDEDGDIEMHGLASACPVPIICLVHTCAGCTFVWERK